MTPTPPRTYALSSLAVVALAVMIAGAVWSVDLRPLNRNEAAVYLRSLGIAGDLAPAGERFTELIDESVRDPKPTTPPGMRLLHGPFIRLFGGNTAYLVLHALLLIPLALGLDGIGRRIGGPTAGVLALFLLLTMPSVIYLALRPTDAFPLLVLSILAARFLLTSDRLSRRRPTIAAGALVGLMILVSPRSFTCVLGAITWALVFGSRDPDRPRGPVAAPLGIGAAALISLPWFLLEGGQYLRSAFGEFSQNILDVLSSNYSYYLVNNLWQSNANGVLIPLGVLAIVLRKRLDDPAWIYLPVLWLLGAIAFLLPLPSGDPDALVPALPALALLAACGVAAVRSRRWRIALIAASVVVQLAGVWNVFASDRLPLSGLNGFAGTSASERFAPLPLDWSVRKIAETIAADPDAPAYRPLRIAVPADLPYLNAETIAAQVGMDGRPAEPVRRAGRAETDYRAAVFSADFVFLKEGYQGRADLADANGDLAAALRREDQAQRMQYVETYPLPDGSMGTLLKRPGVP